MGLLDAGALCGACALAERVSITLPKSSPRQRATDAALP
jgi:hypothetical protein